MWVIDLVRYEDSVWLANSLKQGSYESCSRLQSSLVTHHTRKHEDSILIEIRRLLGILVQQSLE